MKIFSSFLIVIFSLVTSCSNGQGQKTELNASDFNTKLKETPSAIVIDVRTPDEFNGGHIKNALNYDWRGSDFANQVNNIDKAAPVFIYCLSGGRSSSAASNMRALGFSNIIELKGGMMAWRSSGLPETTDATPSKPGMSLEEYKALLTSDKIVLVDFYAEWCAPCKKMKPYLEEISKDMANKVIVIRIDADQNKELCTQLKIDGLPVLIVYKKQELTWKNVGFIEKNEVLKHLN